MNTEEGTLAADGLPPTRKAIKECAEAMVKLLSIGWQKSDLPELQRLWWTVRNSDGNVALERKP